MPASWWCAAPASADPITWVHDDQPDRAHTQSQWMAGPADRLRGPGPGVLGVPGLLLSRGDRADPGRGARLLRPGEPVGGPGRGDLRGHHRRLGRLPGRPRVRSPPAGDPALPPRPETRAHRAWPGLPGQARRPGGVLRALHRRAPRPGPRPGGHGPDALPGLPAVQRGRRRDLGHRDGAARLPGRGELEAGRALRHPGRHRPVRGRGAGPRPRPPAAVGAGSGELGRAAGRAGLPQPPGPLAAAAVPGPARLARGPLPGGCPDRVRADRGRAHLLRVRLVLRVAHEQRAEPHQQRPVRSARPGLRRQPPHVLADRPGQDPHLAGLRVRALAGGDRRRGWRCGGGAGSGCPRCCRRCRSRAPGAGRY